MGPREFFEHVVAPNIEEFLHGHQDDRHAVNALLALDAFFGVLFGRLALEGLTDIADPTAFRLEMASKSQAYAALRDGALMLTDGQIDEDLQFAPPVSLEDPVVAPLLDDDAFPVENSRLGTARELFISASDFARLCLDLYGF